MATVPAGVHVHVAAFVADLLPDAQQSFASVGDPLRGAPRSPIPRFDLQFPARQSRKAESPFGDRLQCETGDTAPTGRRGDPVSNAGPPTSHRPQPDLAQSLVRSGIGDGKEYPFPVIVRSRWRSMKTCTEVGSGEAGTVVISGISASVVASTTSGASAAVNARNTTGGRYRGAAPAR